MRELAVGILPVYESCLESKITKRHFSTKGERDSQPLKLVHSDVYGPLNVQARGCYEYYVTFLDDYSRSAFSYLMAIKFETFGKFMEFQAKAKKQLEKSLKELQSDRGGIYLDT